MSPGDIVALPSGGPDLTILCVHDGDADFGWFTAAGEYRTGTLPLEVVVPRDVSPHSDTLRDNPRLAAALHAVLIEHGIPIRLGLDDAGIDRLLRELVEAAI